MSSITSPSNDSILSVSQEFPPPLSSLSLAKSSENSKPSLSGISSMFCGQQFSLIPPNQLTITKP